MQRIAEARGGACLSPAYVDHKEKLSWRCSKGHVWMASPSKILIGRWCHECNWKRKLTLDDMRAAARARGGDCLSEAYEGVDKNLLWTCAKGHSWNAVPQNIRRGTWCPECAGKRNISVASLEALAAARGGTLDSSQYLGEDEPLSWTCARGHRFSARVGSVRFHGSWCPVCREEDRTRRAFERIVRLVESKGGKCLTAGPVGWKSRIEIACGKGHRWRPKAMYLRLGSWCSRCEGMGKTIDEMQALAARFGAQCLSVTYRDCKTPLIWRCGRGHRFRALAWSMERKFQCPECRVRRRYTFQEIDEIIAAKGGRNLTAPTVFKAAATRMDVQCAKGHRWQPPAHSLRAGSWCPYCARMVKKTIAEMHSLALSRGGRCLSEAYVNTGIPLLWECRKGHRWWARPHNVARGSWCGACLGKPIRP